MKPGKYWILESNIWLIVHQVTETEMLVEIEGYSAYWFDRVSVENDRSIVPNVYKELEALFSIEK